MSARCNGQPISWLLLERFALGELEHAEAQAVSAHLSACPCCQECFASIQAGALKPLPALDFSRAVDSGPAWPLWFTNFWQRPAWVATGLALATAVLMLIVWRPLHDRQNEGHLLPALKGGELTLTLVRLRDGVSDENPATFAPGDRFKALVTCDAQEPLEWTLVVIQSEEESYPFDDTPPINCGNRIPLPGAFSIDGDDKARICIFVSPLERADLPPFTPSQHGDRHACITLQPQSDSE
jgi:hypothetical protein